MEIPVYLFTGFLDSGKTKFIQETLEDKRFHDGERTLVLLCEEGEEEYDPSKYPSEYVYFHTISSQEELSLPTFSSLQKKYRMNRVMIEYNGMWLLDNLLSALPNNWQLYQVMMFADASNFMTYNDNMRNLVVDKLANSEMVIFNRMKKDADIIPYHKIVRATGRGINIAYEYTDGQVQYDEIEDPLPFDINAPIIEISDDDYALWYRDLMEELNKYQGKTVKFKGIVINSAELTDNTYIIGRHIMTCCVDDITFGGMIVINSELSIPKTRDWVWITAQIFIENNHIYNSKGPVLYVKEIEQTIPPKQEIATFY